VLRETSTPSCCGNGRCSGSPRENLLEVAGLGDARDALGTHRAPATASCAELRVVLEILGSGSRRIRGSARMAPRRAAVPGPDDLGGRGASAVRALSPFVTRARRTRSPGAGPRAHEDDRKPSRRADAVCRPYAERLDVELELLIFRHRGRPSPHTKLPKNFGCSDREERFRPRPLGEIEVRRTRFPRIFTFLADDGRGVRPSVRTRDRAERRGGSRPR